MLDVLVILIAWEWSNRLTWNLGALGVGNVTMLRPAWSADPRAFMLLTVTARSSLDLNV